MEDFKNVKTQGLKRKTENTLCAIVPIFLLTFAAFVLLTVTTFSLPFVGSLYFLWASEAGGVRFGIWGWCLDEGNVCSDVLGLGYTWEPQIEIPVTKALAFYPIAAIAVFMTLIALLPILRDRSRRTLSVFAVFAWCSFVFAALAFVFMIAMWSTAEERFKRAGWTVRWGPLPWMSFVATLLLLVVSVNSWKGTLSPMYLTPDLPFSVREWTQTKGEVQPRDSSADLEKATPDTTLSTVPDTPVAAVTRRFATTNTSTMVFLQSWDAKGRHECEQGTAQDDLAHQRDYHDCRARYTDPKLHPLGSGRPPTPDMVHPATPDIAPPPRALRRTSQRRHHTQLTPLHTT